ncbi:MAG: hypothetical protein HY532_00735 [Chloroflexi bacterium]|nr:hypothetical protein [Chloroflexota bacterium]
MGSILLLILGGGYWLRGKFAKIEHELQASARNLELQIRALRASLITQWQFTGIMIGALRRQSILLDSDFTNIEAQYVQANIAAIQQTVTEEERRHNPLSASEVARLNVFIGKAQRGEQFTYDEIQEYQTLVAKLEKDKGGVDPGVVALVGLGALLFGIWLGSQSK